MYKKSAKDRKKIKYVRFSDGTLKTTVFKVGRREDDRNTSENIQLK